MKRLILFGRLFLISLGLVVFVLFMGEILDGKVTSITVGGAILNVFSALCHTCFLLSERKMKFVALSPIEDWHTNSVLLGDGNEIIDLPISKYPDLFFGVHSVWKCKSTWARIKFLFSGKVSFVSQSFSHPPIVIGVGEFLEEIK